MVNEIDGCLFCVSLLNDEILGLEQTVPWFSSLFTLLRVESDGERVEKSMWHCGWAHKAQSPREEAEGIFQEDFFFLPAYLQYLPVSM